METAGWRLVTATAVWVFVLAGAFMLFTGQWTAVNWVGAGAVGLLAGLLTIPLTATGLFQVRFKLSWLKEAGAPLLQVFVDFAIVVGALVGCAATGRRERGAFVARRDFPTGGRDPEGTAWRGLVAMLATWSPNSYVVDIDEGSGHRLSHDLVPRRSSERPA
ncbi:MAG TPA: hypothetical protein VFH58_03990 [Acidimicrobiales bacterium]|nr:hypothetical protein [Acidimicrobiales bacterium]